MKCTLDKNKCDNENLNKCTSCIAPMFCRCSRPEVVAAREALWKKQEDSNDRHKTNFKFANMGT